MASLHRSPSAPKKNVLPPQELLDDLCSHGFGGDDFKRDGHDLDLDHTGSVVDLEDKIREAKKASRLVLNAPKEDLESFERILFLVEQAHWFYEDNSMEQNPLLKSLSLREFTSLMFRSCAALRPYIAHIDDIYKDFNSYKGRVPVSGAIILDESYERPTDVLEYNFRVDICNVRKLYACIDIDVCLKAEAENLSFWKAPSLKTFLCIWNCHPVVDVGLQCLLVKGWKTGSCWGFPRGKRNKDEEDHTCAIRETAELTSFTFKFTPSSYALVKFWKTLLFQVLEETGFDVSKLLKMDDFFEVTIGQQRVQLYIIAGVKDDTVFAPQTKKEISEISWHRVDELPAGNDVVSRGTNGLKLYMVGPFLASLKAWILAYQPPMVQKSDMRSKGTCMWKAKSSFAGVTKATMNQSTKPGSEIPLSHLGPGKSFRSFRFDSASILQAMEDAFPP
ncbi:hypothetical protein HHK36_018936 [Tetracentron sinense]|uniref:Nudix hydrolase domain-containing protein n=1 Tax=Tetracentron sinense TaxID=13715 RepID=A0A835DBR5_TETSI|nr:hypothetical protein HHK36_018936 [Tetracentron sinense]